MTRRLKIWYSDPAVIEAELEWQNGTVQIVRAASDLMRSLEDFVLNGVSEWVGSKESACPRKTSAQDPDFLPRLGALLERQASFQYRVLDEPLALVLPNASVPVARDRERIARNVKQLNKSIEAGRKRVET